MIRLSVAVMDLMSGLVTVEYTMNLSSNNGRMKVF